MAKVEQENTASQDPQDSKDSQDSKEEKALAVEEPKSAKAAKEHTESPRTEKAEKAAKEHTESPRTEKAEKLDGQAASPQAEQTETRAKNEVSARPKREFYKKDSDFVRRRAESGDRPPMGRPPTGSGGRFWQRRRVLDTRKITIDYKKSVILERFISKTGKILPRRVTGANALVQRKIAREIKRARHIGLLPYSDR